MDKGCKTRKLKEMDMDNRRRIVLYTVFVALVLVLQWNIAFAGKASVQIKVPESASAGEVILIQLHVSHEGNNFIHFTDWVYVTINSSEVKRWTFSNFDKPESENFTRTINHTMTGPIEIKAEADCNIHGSEGIAKKNVAIKQ
jgi:desulfoferrodoxin (superoxide reductase-like protein)